MKRVTGIGGVFFKCKDPESLRKWYQTHLGIESNQYGAMFHWEDGGPSGTTAWNPFLETTGYFKPSEKSFMFNYRVEDLENLLKVLKEEGVQVVGEMEVYEYGKFGWVMDPEDNKIELWEPPVGS